jgi:predicted nucleotide-binding protein
MPQANRQSDDIDRIIERLATLSGLSRDAVRYADLFALQRDVDDLIRQRTADQTGHVELLPQQSIDSRRAGADALPGDFDLAARIKGAIDVLKQLRSQPISSRDHSAKRRVSRARPQTPGGSIFIIHGRDHGDRDSVDLFLRELGLATTVIMNEPSSGRFIFEKIEDAGQSSFAVALFTGDDKGHAVGEESAIAHRPRQNVVFELGYFCGLLGRRRVCVLKRGEMEMPSDLRGIITIPFQQSGAWKLQLAKELHAAGFDIDLDDVIAVKSSRKSKIRRSRAGSRKSLV